MKGCPQLDYPRTCPSDTRNARGAKLEGFGLLNGETERWTGATSGEEWSALVDHHTCNWRLRGFRTRLPLLWCVAVPDLLQLASVLRIYAPVLHFPLAISDKKRPMYRDGGHVLYRPRASPHNWKN